METFNKWLCSSVAVLVMFSCFQYCYNPVTSTRYSDDLSPHTSTHYRWYEQARTAANSTPTSPLPSTPWGLRPHPRTSPCTRSLGGTRQTTILWRTHLPLHLTFPNNNKSFTPLTLTKSEVMLMMKQMKPKIQQLTSNHRLLLKSSQLSRPQRDWNGSF